MKLYIDESDYDDNYYDYDYDYEDYNDTETYYYEVDYFTYYGDEYNMYCPLSEIDKSDEDIIPMDDDTDPLLYVTKMESDINADVQNGKYKGLYVHHIVIPIVSNYEQVDVDRWVGSSYVDANDVDYDSDMIPMPDDYNPDEYTETDLAEYAENYIGGMNSD